jgi:3-deoxy-D-manno-octulosonate 8-phosphate phosphatase (KDO 8-P phosphatase)
MRFNKDQQNVESLAKGISLLLLDVDGVLTDGRLYFSNSGEEIKAFHSLDGHGIKMLKQSGIEVGIITGRSSALLKKRASDLGIELLYQGREDKLNVLEEILSNSDINKNSIAYVGDDFPDLPVLKSVALGFSVPGAHPLVKEAVHAISDYEAGMGAVREITDFILSSQGKMEAFLKS